MSFSTESELSSSGGSSNESSPSSRSSASSTKYKVKLPFMPQRPTSDAALKSSTSLPVQAATKAIQRDTTAPRPTRRLIPKILAEPEEIGLYENEQEWYRKAYGSDIVVVGPITGLDEWILVDGIDHLS